MYKSDLLMEIERCTSLYKSGIFSKRHIYMQSAFIEVLVRLNYVLQKLSKGGNRVSWVSDIKISENIKDITDLVNGLRNAACHNDSLENYINGSSIKFVFNTFIGRCLNAFKTGDETSLGCEYEDDTAFYYGDKRIYLNRHIGRLLKELPSEIDKLK